jgi:hypothetical protein
MTRWQTVLSLALVLGSVGTDWAQLPPVRTQGSGTLPAPVSTPPAGPSIVYSDKPSLLSSDDENSCSQSYFQSGAALHVLRPVIGNNFGMLFETFTSDQPGPFDGFLPASSHFENFNYPYTISPSVWVGYTTDSGLGVRLNWFHFDQDANTLTAVEHALVPVGGSGAGTVVSSPSAFVSTLASGSVLQQGQSAVYIATNRLFLDVWDFDVTQTFKVCQLDITAGGGLRYLHMNQTYDVSRTHQGLPRGEFDNEFESDSNSFNGFGPTALLEVQRPIGCGGLGLYGDARVGLLFGVRRETCIQQRDDNVLQELESASTGSGISSTSDQLVGFAEIELGLEWARPCGRLNPFLRVGFEGRGYFGTGNAQSGAVLFSAIPEVPSLGHTADVGLYGLTAQAGLTY